MAEFIQKYISLYLHKDSIKTTLWQSVITQMYAEQFSSGSYGTYVQQPLALALDDDIYENK
jgi:hypothetical protein